MSKQRIKDITTNFDVTKLVAPTMTIQSFEQASAVSESIRQNYEYLSTIIDRNLLDVTVHTLGFLENAVKEIKTPLF